MNFVLLSLFFSLHFLIPRDISSEPASAFGHKIIAGKPHSLTADNVSHICFSPSPYSVVTGCCETKTKGLLISIVLPTPSLRVSSSINSVPCFRTVETKSILGQPTK